MEPRKENPPFKHKKLKYNGFFLVGGLQYRTYRLPDSVGFQAWDSGLPVSVSGKRPVYLVTVSLALSLSFRRVFLGGTVAADYSAPARACSCTRLVLSCYH